MSSGSIGTLWHRCSGGGGSLGAAGRLGLCDFGHIDSIHSRVAFGGGFG
jgi:hypothetical protein